MSQYFQSFCVRKSATVDMVMRVVHKVLGLISAIYEFLKFYKQKHTEIVIGRGCQRRTI